MIQAHLEVPVRAHDDGSSASMYDLEILWMPKLDFAGPLGSTSIAAYVPLDCVRAPAHPPSPVSLFNQNSKDLEIVVLRHQLRILRRQVARPELRKTDRLFPRLSAVSCLGNSGIASWSLRRLCLAPHRFWSVFVIPKWKSMVQRPT